MNQPLSEKVYEPLSYEELDPKGNKSSAIIRKIIADDIDFAANAYLFEDKYQLKGSGDYTVSLARLSYLGIGDSMINQFEILPSKAVNFLTDPQVGFLKIGKMMDDIVVGIVSTPEKQKDGMEREEIEEMLNDILNEYVITISGRHRIVALNTLCLVHTIDLSNVMVRVRVKIYESWEEASLAVMISNKSRSMTSAEKLNMTVNSKGVDTNSVVGLSEYAEENTGAAKNAFVLATSVDAKYGLTRNTIATIAKTFINRLAQDKKYSIVTKHLHKQQVLREIVEVFFTILEKSDLSGNVARRATRIGIDLYYATVTQFEELLSKALPPSPNMMLPRTLQNKSKEELVEADIKKNNKKLEIAKKKAIKQAEFRRKLVEQAVS